MLALCPGNTATNFADVANADETRMTRAETPETVVEEGLRAFLKGRNYVIPGRSVNYLLANLSRLLPRRRVLGITSGIFKPDTPRCDVHVKKVQSSSEKPSFFGKTRFLYTNTYSS